MEKYNYGLGSSQGPWLRRRDFKSHDGTNVSRKMDEHDRLRVEIVTQLAQKKVVGSHKKQVDTVKNWFRTDRQGQVEDVIREMVRDPETPLEGYGGRRDNVRLTSVAAAKEYLLANDGDLPWGLRER